MGNSAAVSRGNVGKFPIACEESGHPVAVYFVTVVECGAQLQPQFIYFPDVFMHYSEC